MEIATSTDVGAAVEAGKQAVPVDDRISSQAYNPDSIPIVLLRQGERIEPLVQLLELQDARAPAPRRRKGTATFTELDSFIEHVNRFKDKESVIFADVEDPELTAVLDYHPGGTEAPRWGQHRSVYTLPLSKKWRLWTGKNETPMGQEEFAAFIEEHLDDIRTPVGNGEDKTMPAPSELLTMAKKLIIRSKGIFEREINPVTGEYSLVSKYENTAESTKIPPAFMIGIPVFEAGALYALTARMRFSLVGGRPTFAYSLLNPDEKKRDAFNEVRMMAAQRTELPVLAGSPE
jgi:uncharacterized protein YfdQ (DUF2303 family)